jgi:hypothetical protein
LLDEALAQADRAEDRPGRGLILLSLALAAHQLGDAARAGRLLADSLRLRRELGQRLGMAECLEGLATLAVGAEQAAAALRRLGAAAALRAALGAPRPPVGRDVAATTLARLRAEVGDAAGAAALAEGRTWPLDRAVEEALGERAAAPAARGPDE